MLHSIRINTRMSTTHICLKSMWTQLVTIFVFNYFQRSHQRHHHNGYLAANTDKVSLKCENTNYEPINHQS